MQILTPPAPAAQRLGSLLAAAATPDRIQFRAAVQYGVDTAACSGWKAFDECTAVEVDNGFDTDPDDGYGLPDPSLGLPWGITAGDRCSTMTRRTFADRQARARARLELVESAAISRELWTGELAAAADDEAGGGSPWALNHRLAGPDTTTVVGGSAAVPIVEAIAALEQALADAMPGVAGALHMTPATLIRAAKVGPAPRVDGFALKSLRDTRWIADDGYPGTGPDGSPPDAGEAWIYASSVPVIWRSDVQAFADEVASLDRSVNTLVTTVSELVLVRLTCGVFAARATLD